MENRTVKELLTEYKVLSEKKESVMLNEKETKRYLYLKDFFDREMEHFERHAKHEKDIKEIEDETHFALLYSKTSISVSVIACVAGLAGLIFSIILLFTY